MPSRPKKESVKKGDKVQAKWSGSNIFYPAVILEQSGGKQCKVQFEDGSVSSVKMSDIKIPKPEPEFIRTRSRSRSSGRSSGKKRSPSRSPSRTRVASKPEKKVSSPKSKTVQTKAKNSHSEVTSLDKPFSEEVSVKILNLNLASSSSSSSSKTTSVFTNSTKEKVVYSEVVEEESKKRERDNTLNLRTSARIAALQTAKAASSAYQATERKGPVPTLQPLQKQKAYAVDDDSDADSEEEVDEAAPQKKFSFVSFSVVFFKIFYLLMPVLFFCFACTKSQCTIYDIPPVYNKWKDFENDVKFPLLACAVFHLLLCIFSKIPIGPQLQITKSVLKGEKGKNYRVNGFYLLLLTVMAFICVLCFGGPVVSWRYIKMKPIIISLTIYSTLWSIIMYIYGLLKNYDFNEKKPFHRAGFLGDFYFGHELNPWLFGREDVKTRFIHFGLIGLMLLELCVLSKFFLNRNYFPIPLILTSSMHMLFIIDYFWREACILSSAMYTDEGVGFGFIVGIGSTIPGFLLLQTAYLANYSEKAIHLPLWCSAAIAILFLCGLYIFDSSTSLKHQFRKNPYTPSLSRVVSIPTSKKKRLIISGLWGTVRHPNYLGLIIMIIACSLPCGFTHALPYIPMFFFLVLFILRTLKVEVACRNMYGPAWQNYVEIVPYRIIPYVF